MTNTKLISASVVTPHKVHRDRKIPARRLSLNQALVLGSAIHTSGTTTTNGNYSQTTSPQKQPPKLLHSNASLSSSSSPSSQQHPQQHRVFRCLSNTTSVTANKSLSTTAISPEAQHGGSVGRRLSSSSNRSSLKLMFQPPTSSVRQQHQQQNKHYEQPRSPVPQRQTRVALVQVNFESSAFFGSRIDPSTRTQQPLRSSKPTLHMEEETKGQEEEPQATASTSSSSAEKSTTTGSSSGELQSNQHKKQVNFQPMVSVIRIPSHRDYATQTKRSLWGSIKEIKANAIRNTAEFLYDRCNWRKATEEDRMYRDSRSGAFIHPVHVQRYYAHAAARQEKKKAQQLQQQKEEQKSTIMKQERHHDEEESEQQVAEEQDHSSAMKHEQHATVPKNSVADDSRSRKRMRCCSPSPIRRSSPQQHACRQDYDLHEHKRQRIPSSCCVPSVPTTCCHPNPIYYAQQQPGPLPPPPSSYGPGPLFQLHQQHMMMMQQQQENWQQQQENCYVPYGYYHEYDQQQLYQQHAMMQQYPCNGFPHQFPPPPTTEIA